MKRTAGKTKRVLAVLMFTVMTVTCLSACAGGEAEIRPPWHPSDIQKPVQESEPAAVTQTPENAPAGSMAADPAPVQTPEKTEAPEDGQAPEEPASRVSPDWATLWASILCGCSKPKKDNISSWIPKTVTIPMT